MVPPLAATVVLYEVPTIPLGTEVVVIVGPLEADIAKLYGC